MSELVVEVNNHAARLAPGSDAYSGVDATNDYNRHTYSGVESDMAA